MEKKEDSSAEDWCKWEIKGEGGITLFTTKNLS